MFICNGILDDKKPRNNRTAGLIEMQQMLQVTAPKGVRFPKVQENLILSWLERVGVRDRDACSIMMIYRTNALYLI
jgi:hypothetical protein